MRIPNANLRAALLQTARISFLSKGFKGTSMREIAAKSGVGLSNIYNYFPSKDALFRAVLSPLLQRLERLAEGSEGEEYPADAEAFTSTDFREQILEQYRGIILRYRAELRLLFFASQGSALEDYGSHLVDLASRESELFLKSIASGNPRLQNRVSPFFVHVACGWWVNVWRELALHDELTTQELERFTEELVRFDSAGWQEILREGDEAKAKIPEKQVKEKRATPWNIMDR